MKSYFLGLIMALVVHYSYSQKPPAKFGDVKLTDLQMIKYEPDTSASAVILVDYGESSLQYHQDKGFVLLFERLTRIKILKKEGLDWANFKIPLYKSGTNDEKVGNLKAVTYNLENGKIVETKVKSEGIFKEKVNTNRDVMKVAMPNVKAGSVVEITYKVFSDFLFNFQDWEFQDRIPVVWSEYRARIPEYFNYDKYSQGYIGFAISENTKTPGSITINSKERSEGKTAQTTFSSDKIDFQTNCFRWAAKDVPAFKPEPFTTTYRDYISKINFELASIKYPNSPIKNYMGSWEDINKTYAASEDFGAEVKGNNFLKKTVDEITAGLSKPEEKIAAIHSYVKSNILWDGYTQSHIRGSLKKVLEDKKGNSAEINFVMISMLDKAGFEVYPVLMSTRDHGFVREYIPMSSQFNNVLCLTVIDNKKILLDATEKLLPVGTLPERCLNGKGLVISKAGHSWVDLNSNIKSRTVVSADIKLDNAGVLGGKILMDRGGYAGLSARKKYMIDGESDYVKAMRPANWEVAKSDFHNVKEVDQIFKEVYDIEINDHVTMAGNLIYMNPFVYLQQNENPFKLDKREYPVDFGYTSEKIYFLKMTIPDDYVVEELPTSKVFVLAGNSSRYLYNVTQSGNIISVTSTLSINRSMFTQDEYPNLREFYNQIVAKQTEQIVLKKK